MFCLTLWRIKRALQKGEPGFSVTKKWSTKRIVAEITEEGVRKYTVHKLLKVGEKKYWFYTTFELCADGTERELRSGKYPYQFTSKR